jgi:cytoskeleton protein RodZ
MNLDVWVVEAIESNRFSALGPPVYARGHLRKYAALLGLSPEEVLARYEHLNDTPTVQDPIPATVAAPIRGVRAAPRKWLRVVGIVAIVAVLVAIALFLWRHFGISIRTGSIELPGQAAVSNDVEQPRERDAIGSSQSSAEAAPLEPAPAASTVADAQPVASRGSAVGTVQAALDSSSVTVHLDFNETSWTEIYDATGKRLMFDNGVAGHSRTVTGSAPLRVTVGLASGVKLEVNSRPAVIPRQPGRESARFTVAVDGTVSEGRD